MNRTKTRISAVIMAAVISCASLFNAQADYRTYDFSELHDIYSMGTGKLCAYGREGNIYQIFGNPYSGPSMLGMLYAEGTREMEVESSRIPRTAIWNHTLSDNGALAARITDMVSYSGSSLVRKIKAKKTVCFDFGACFEARYMKHVDAMHFEEVSLDGFTSAWKVTIDPGVPFYSRYESKGGYSYYLATKGKASVESYDADRKMMLIKAGKGTGYIYVISASMEKEGVASDLDDNARTIAGTSWRKLFRECRKCWYEYSRPQAKLDFSALDRNEGKKLSEAVDDIGTLLKSQQDKDGGVLAGVVYHMVYVRDHYGVSRSFLALGHTDEARKVLEFYFSIWQKYGLIHNAQAAGWEGIFHPHENDDTEITGYLIVQAFDYYEKSGDAEFIRKILPMLEWAAKAQQACIVDGMLPFNGDETYIAGGVIPRSVMFHGSAEATLLFIEGGRKLLDFVTGNNLWSEEQVASLKGDIDNCTELYRSNFFADGKFYINNPSREEKIEFPQTRPGVCLYPGYLEHYPVTYHFKGSLYFCEECMKRDMTGIEIPEIKRYSIPSAKLFPFYIDAQLFTEEEKAGMLQEVIDLYQSTGKISSQNTILGYDYGMFLYALVKSGNPLADEVYEKMMAQRDSTGAWVEYYVEGVPSGCPCRPWESGINIEAAITYATR